jgi:hypothetical protein
MVRERFEIATHHFLECLGQNLHEKHSSDRLPAMALQSGLGMYFCHFVTIGQNTFFPFGQYRTYKSLVKEFLHLP